MNIWKMFSKKNIPWFCTFFYVSKNLHIIPRLTSSVVTLSIRPFSSLASFSWNASLTAWLVRESLWYTKFLVPYRLGPVRSGRTTGMAPRTAVMASWEKHSSRNRPAQDSLGNFAHFFSAAWDLLMITLVGHFLKDFFLNFTVIHCFSDMQFGFTNERNFISLS